MWDEIAAVFHLKPGRGIIFSWGADRIYNPDGVVVGPDLLAHEAVHGERQGTNPASIRQWWVRYLDDPQFRLQEELPAHVCEYQWWLQNGTRPERRRALKEIAYRLSSPLYGRLIGKSMARDLLRRGQESLAA